ncbi:hypothetical protein V5799_028967 [Amblyomma americanum]|uniref:Uncharacterized protein n=1 Tax=Amblyomma americanum TaxID=6943 RepID=A0AAQ4ESV1_AMBAM
MAVALNAVVHQAVESSAGELWELGQFLWGNPETSMKEATAHDKLSEFLERKGFQVARRYLLDTAFRAEFCAPGGIDGVLFGDADEALVVSAASSSDSGNVSQALPCLQAAFAIASAGANHSKTFAAAAGSREAQAPTRRAAKILALTALDLYTDPKLLGRVKQEFHDWKSNQQEDRKENKQPCGS